MNLPNAVSILRRWRTRSDDRTIIRSTFYAISLGTRRCEPVASALNVPVGEIRRICAAQFALPDILKVSPILELGNPSEIARRFGGPEKLRQAVDDMAGLLYAA